MKKVSCAFIPVRGGSKGIPGKNIKLFCGKPLVYWTVKAAVDCSTIDRVYVSTEDAGIRKIVEGFNFSKVEIVDRSLQSARDEASSEEVLVEFLSQRTSHKIIVFIQATSPLLKSSTLEAAVKKYEDQKSDSLLSVFSSHRFIWKPEGNGSGYIVPVNYDPLRRPRRQEWQGELIENGAFYISSRESILESGCRISGNISYYEMSQEDSLEIDNEHDWRFAESVMRRQRSSSLGDLIKTCRPNLMVCDVDGTLTDAGMYTSENGDIYKKFNTRDGHGLAQLRSSGMKVMFLTSEDSSAVVERAKKLKIDFVAIGIKDKNRYLEDFFSEHAEYTWDTTIYIGDDINDLAPLRRVGFSACPHDAHPSVREAVHFVCDRSGGDSCVRELCDLLSREIYGI